MEAPAAWTEPGYSSQLGRDVIFPFGFLEVQHPQAQKVQDMSWHSRLSVVCLNRTARGF